LGRAAPRPDTMDASGVRTLVLAGAWRASSVRSGDIARASSRAPLQTCIPTPRTERHTPVPRGDLRSISPSVPTFHSSRTARVKGAPRTGGGPENPTWPSIGNGASDLRGESAEPEIQRGGPRTAMRVPVPRTRSRIRTRRPGRALSRMLLGSTPRSASGPELADRGDRLIRAIDNTCVYVPGNPATGIRAIDAAAPCTGTSLRRVRGERCTNHRS
jgi:hypothetical protein